MMKTTCLTVLSLILLLAATGCGRGDGADVSSPTGGRTTVNTETSQAVSSTSAQTTVRTSGAFSSAFGTESTPTAVLTGSSGRQTSAVSSVPSAAETTARSTGAVVTRPPWTETRQLILTCDQKARRLVILDATDADWQDEGSVVWEWRPTAANGFADVAGTYWLPSECKLRYSEQHHTYVILTCASGGTCAMLEYPSGKRLWATTKESGNNPHSMELLPNGNIAVASSGGTLRVYAASQAGEAGQRYTETFLDSAHGVEWDASARRLLATYYHGVKAYTVGTADRPELTEDISLRADREWLCGHDLIAIPQKAGQYWITGSGGLWVYSAHTGRLCGEDTALAGVDGDFNIKSVDALPDGTIIRAMPMQGAEDRTGLEQYQSNAVVFTRRSSEKNSYVSSARLLPSGMAIYKARSFTPVSQG